MAESVPISDQNINPINFYQLYQPFDSHVVVNNFYVMTMKTLLSIVFGLYISTLFAQDATRNLITMPVRFVEPCK